MKRVFAVLAAVLMLGLFVQSSKAHMPLRVHISRNALSDEEAVQLVQLLERALGDVELALTGEERTLEELVMADEAPHLAICPVQEAARWASEGMLRALDADLASARRVAAAVSAACTGQDERLYMAPLLAKQECVAVNRRMLEDAKLDHLLDMEECPVWLPLQLYQVLEEAMILGRTAMDVWPAGAGSDAVLTLVQAIYGGSLSAADDNAASGLEWLEEMTASGMIGVVNSKEEAMQRFLAGETVLCIGWTKEDERAFAAKNRNASEVALLPYPSSAGLPVRAVEVVGAIVFESGDADMDALAESAVAFLMEDAQAGRVLGGRGIEEDGALWLPPSGAVSADAGMRGMLREMVNRVLSGDIKAETAIDVMRAVFGRAGN